MRGLELSEAFYRECGEPMLRENFPEILPKIAVGLAGSGSEVLGFDDEVSEDHDFAPGFCIFLPSEEAVDRRTEFLLERAYAKLPSEFMGYRRPRLSPVGGNRLGVIRMADFFTEKVGDPGGELTEEAWLRIPSFYLLEAVNGEVYHDGSGVFTGIRERLRDMPEDVRKKRLAGQLFLMAQAGSYNYPRCLRHGETGAAALALSEYVRAALSAAFLLAGEYEPYYKWSFRALRDWGACRKLFGEAKLGEKLEELLSSGNEGDLADRKRRIIRETDLIIGRAGESRGFFRGLPEGGDPAWGEKASGERRTGSEKERRGSAASEGEAPGGSELSLSGRILSQNPDRLAFSAGGAFRREEDGGVSFDPERAAYEVNDRIGSARIRELNILYTV